MKPEKGQRVGNQLTLVRPIDGGAMGSVWVADHRTLRTEVAVKFVDRDLASDDPSALERFRHEASASARIKSPHVVKVFDHDFTDDGTPYIVMELLEGETLRQRLGRGPLSLIEAAQVVTHVSRALARAHEVGVIHRDIKPENIFLSGEDDEMFCRVFDFGIAKQVELPELDGLTNPGLLVGTPEFMSPELFSNKAGIDVYADLWALAAVAYYALSEQLPFPGDNIGELCTNLLTKEVEPITTLRDDLPELLDGWFAKALAKERRERFGSARELSKAFVACVEPSQRSLMPSELGRFSHPDLTAEAAKALAAIRSAPPHRLSQSSGPAFSVDYAASQRPAADDGAAASVGRRKLMVFGAVATLVLAGVIGTVISSGDEPAPAAEQAPPAEPKADEAKPEAPAAIPSAAPSATPEAATAAPSASASSASGSEAVAGASPTASANATPPKSKAPMPKRAPGSRGYDWAF